MLKHDGLDASQRVCQNGEMPLSLPRNRRNGSKSDATSFPVVTLALHEECITAASTHMNHTETLA